MTSLDVTRKGAERIIGATFTIAWVPWHPWSTVDGGTFMAPLLPAVQVPFRSATIA